MRVWRRATTIVVALLAVGFATVLLVALSGRFGRIEPLGSVLPTASTTVVVTYEVPPPTPPAPPTPPPPDFTPPAPIISTATVYTITSTIDMSPTLPADQKGELIVRRSDGTYYRILTMPGSRMSDLPLQPGDVVVVFGSPMAIVGKHPEAPTPTAIATPTAEAQP
ncbi:MAG: hypothetical protein M1546_23455 [Chloroflexi bacterium]|nr:hypothetical protein [Chloroflexota bacterium]